MLQNRANSENLEKILDIKNMFLFLMLDDAEQNIIEQKMLQKIKKAL